VSIPATTWAFQQTDLPPTRRFVLVALADMLKMGQADCWPSIATLADRTGLSERSVRYALRDLEADHYVHVAPARRGRTPTYRLPWMMFGAGQRAGQVAKWERLYGGSSCPPPSDGDPETTEIDPETEVIHRKGGSSCPPPDGLTEPNPNEGGSSCPSGGQLLPLRGAALAPESLKNRNGIGRGSHELENARPEGMLQKVARSWTV
jgi:DNA-binding transcriptional ArsR family regulator